MSSDHIESTEKDGITILKIRREELRDTGECYVARDQILAELNPNTTDRVVIDMANVRFVGSIGLLAFLAMRRTVPNARIILCNLDESVSDVFVLCRLVSGDNDARAPFEVRASLQDAVAELQN